MDAKGHSPQPVSPVLTAAFEPKTRMLVLRADLRRGWRNAAGTSRFTEGCTIELPGANIGRVRLVVTERVLSETVLLATEERPRFPNGRYAFAPDLFEMSLDDNVLTMRLALLTPDGSFNRAFRWIQRPRRNPFFEVRLPIFFRIDGPEGDLKLTVTVKPPATKSEPIYKEWQRRFFPGGLPSLGKRRK